MYGKIFEDIFDSSLIAEGGWLPTYVFMSLITIADKDGLAEIAPRALYRKLGMSDCKPEVSFDDFEAALGYLEEKDSDSRSDHMDGRRIVKLSEVEEVEGNRGWLIVNYEAYRKKGSRSEDKGSSTDRVRRFRERQANQQLSENETPCNGNETDCNGHTDTDTDTDTDKTQHTSSSDAVGVAKATPCPHQEIINLYHTHCPDLPRVRTWEGMRKQNLRQRFQVRNNLDWWEWFFQVINSLDFYNGRVEGRTWRANLDWIVKHSNFQKLVDICYERTETQRA